MTAKDITLDLVIRYGFQVLGAIIILTVGVLLARWVGNFTNRWLEPRVKEPPMRLLMVRTIRILVLILALLVALDKFGFQIAPLVAAIGVAGVGVGFAFQGVLGNIVAGLSIIFTKPYRVGEYIELLNVHGRVVTIELFSTKLLQLDLSRVVIPNRRIVGEILHNYGTIRQLELKVGVSYGANLPVNVEQFDIFSNPVRFGKNDRESSNNVPKNALKSESHAHASDPNRGNEWRNLKPKLVERHQQREHEDENSDCPDHQ